jgi:hypothetical protein
MYNLTRSAAPRLVRRSRSVRQPSRRTLGWFSGWTSSRTNPPLEAVPEATLPPVVVADTVQPPILVGEASASVSNPPPVPQSAPSSPSTASTTGETSSNTASPPIGNTFSTVNQAEIDHFSRLSSQWWNEKGEFGLLHKMNPTRMEFVRQKIVQGLQDDEGWSFEKRDKIDERGNLKRWEGMAMVKGKGRWLEGMDVLDVGCGGGLLSEVSLLSSRTRIS